MLRSLKVHPQYIEQVKHAVKRSGFPRQKDLAEDLQLSLATISNFLNGRPVDYLNFVEICQKLNLNYKKIPDFDFEGSDNSSPPVDIEPEKLTFNYIERPPIESNCYETILKPGSLLRIKAPQRMGKTWLINRLIPLIANQNYQTVYLSLLLADGVVLKSLDQYLRWFCIVICQQLRLPPQLANYWEDGLGSNYNCTIFFEEHLLAQIDRPLVLFLDDVDRIFPHSQIAQDFLGLLRAWYERARTLPIWKKLRLVVAHSTEVYIPLNQHQSPFNVGDPIELLDFSPEQVQDLARRQKLDWNTLEEIAQLMFLVKGHPYLVQRAIYKVTRQEITFEQLLRTAYTESGIYNDHLRGHLWNLQQHPELVTAIKKVVNATSPIQLEPMEAFKLQSLGLVQWDNNYVKPRCNLYSQYFRQHLNS